MSDAKSPSDLSIDEILTTIRRIISEDEQGGGASTATGMTTPPPSSPPPVASSDTGLATTRPAAAPASPPIPAPADKGDEDDILELTEALNEDGTTRHLAPIGGSARRVGPTAGQPSVREPLDLRGTAMQTDAAAGGQRLSRDVAVGAAGRTLEDVVGDALRPLLQAWLDENLRPMVERLVQAEVARVAREAGSA